MLLEPRRQRRAGEGARKKGGSKSRDLSLPAKKKKMYIRKMKHTKTERNLPRGVSLEDSFASRRTFVLKKIFFDPLGSPSSPAKVFLPVWHL